VDHCIIWGASGGVHKIHLIHVKAGKLDSIASEKNKNRRSGESQRGWQKALTLQ